MVGKNRVRSHEEISRNMASVLRSGSALEKRLCSTMRASGLRPTCQPKGIFGKPDFAFVKKRIAIFCDSHFWHGYQWELHAQDHKLNREFWIPKIERNIARDKEVNSTLRRLGWIVLRFWQHEVWESPDKCVRRIKSALQRRAYASAGD
jgi:DNA mismatch endonuclease Vsr